MWDTYALPPYKRNHSQLVARVSLWFAHEYSAHGEGSIDMLLLEAGSLLHDIDKNAPKRPGEHHPDTGVRLLKEAGYNEVADLVRTHPLHAILDQSIAPKTIEQKLLYLADKMVKHEVITVDKRFDLWKSEPLPEDGKRVLEAAYPKVKELEREILEYIGVSPEEVAGLANAKDLSTMKLV